MNKIPLFVNNMCKTYCEEEWNFFERNYRFKYKWNNARKKPIRRTFKKNSGIP